MRRTNRGSIRHVEKHQGIAMDFWYLDTESGRQFDVRDIPPEMTGPVDRNAMLLGDRAEHRKAIRHALDRGFELNAPRAASAT